MVGRVSCLIDKRNMNLFQLAQICEITCSTVSNSKRQARRLSVDKGYDREDMRVSGETANSISKLGYNIRNDTIEDAIKFWNTRSS